MNLLTHLPKEINDSLTCFTFVNNKVIDKTPDIVTCNGNGYMYEVKNKKVIRSLNLQENATSVSCYYLFDNKELILFYVVLTSNQKLLVIRRARNNLKVVQSYEGVGEFQVFDFECLGFPQIKMIFVDENRSTLCHFPVESPVIEKRSEIGSSMTDSLIEELQILNRHVDELTEEYNQLRNICSISNSPVNLGQVSVGSLSFSSSLSKNGKQKLLVLDKWQRIYGSNLILGLRLRNVSNRTIQDYELLINHKNVKNYTYRFFEGSRDLDVFSPRNMCKSVTPEQDIYAVGSFHVPEFLEPELLIVCHLTTSDLKENLAKEIFKVNIWDVASKTTTGLEERFTMEDLMAVVTVNSETRVKIQTEYLNDEEFESVVVKNLRLERIKHLKDKFFYCTSTYLKEVFVGLRHVKTNPNAWLMVIYAGEPSQVCFIINALHDLLPDDTEIKES